MLNTPKLILLAALFGVLCPACTAQPASGAAETESRQDETTYVLNGADRTELWVPLLRERRIALVVNHSSTLGSRHLVDSMLGLDLDVRAIFAPEHGFRGMADAGAAIADGKDPGSGLPLFSLYGQHKKPSAEQLRDIDVVVFDIQDVGARFYTYISTLHYVMEACAEQSVDVVVFDRPNPNGHYIDGPLLEERFKSFVGMHPIPLVHGMTVAELAQMINGEGWLSGSAKASLSVVPCLGWDHQQLFEPPIPPSPNLKTLRSIYLYPGLCLFEGTVVSVGRGTAWPFEMIGHPEYPDRSFQFIPEPMSGASSPLLQGKVCYGMDFRQSHNDSLRARARIELQPLLTFYEKLNNKNAFFLKNGFFDKLAGTDQLRRQIQAGLSEAEIRLSWAEDLEAFARQRKPYLLYRE